MNRTTPHPTDRLLSPDQRGPRPRRVGRTTRTLGTSLFLAGALLVAGPQAATANDGNPTAEANDEAYANLSYDLVAECTSQLLTGVRLTNSGLDDVEVFVDISWTTGGVGMATTVPAGGEVVRTSTLSMPSIARVTVTGAGAQLLFDSGERSSMDALRCNEPPLPLGFGLSFSHDTVCAADAVTTVTITNEYESVDLKTYVWVDATPIESSTITVGSHSVSATGSLGAIVRINVFDVFDRIVYTTGDLVSTAGECGRPAIRDVAATTTIVCDADGAAVRWAVTNAGDFDDSVWVGWSTDDDGNSTSFNLAVGESTVWQFAAPEGALIEMWWGLSEYDPTGFQVLLVENCDDADDSGAGTAPTTTAPTTTAPTTTAPTTTAPTTSAPTTSAPTTTAPTTAAPGFEWTPDTTPTSTAVPPAQAPAAPAGELPATGPVTNALTMMTLGLGALVAGLALRRFARPTGVRL